MEDSLQESIDEVKIINGYNDEDFEDWSRTDDDDDHPIDVSYYFWNITNPDEFLQGEKPIFDEVGPYRWNWHLQKINVNFRDDSTEAWYDLWAYYTDVPSEPYDPYNDIILIPDVGLQSVNYFTPKFANTTIFQRLCSQTNTTFFTKKTPNEIVFGYTEELLVKVNSYLDSFELPTYIYIDENYTSPEDLYQRTDGQMGIKTGSQNLEEVAKLVGWNGRDNLMRYWGNEEAAKFQGTNSEQYPKQVNRREKYSVWVENFYRSLNFTYSEEVEFKGINLYRFRMDPEALLNSSQVPYNAAWHQYGASGVLNISSGALAPIFISKPHFLDADQSYRDNIYNMTPNYEEHDPYLDIEPISGFSMHIGLRSQVNLYVQPYKSAPNVNPTYYPLCWNYYEVQISDKKADDFSNSVYSVRDWETILLWVCVTMAISLMIICISLYVYLKFFHFDEQSRAERKSLLKTSSSTRISNNSRNSSTTNATELITLNSNSQNS